MPRCALPAERARASSRQYPDPYTGEAAWETVTTTLVELEEFTRGLRPSKDRDEKALYRRLLDGALGPVVSAVWHGTVVGDACLGGLEAMAVVHGGLMLQATHQSTMPAFHAHPGMAQTFSLGSRRATVSAAEQRRKFSSSNLRHTSAPAVSWCVLGTQLLPPGFAV